MAQVIKEIELEVSKPNFIQAIVAKQYDNKSRYLRVKLVDNGEKITVADTSAVTINARRSDGGEKKFAGSVDKGKGTVLVPLAYWMLELEGTVKSDVSVTDTSGRTLTTTNFTIEVERASCQDGGVSEDDANIDILTQLILDVQSIKPDTTYNPESTNAQSGIAVAQAVNGAKTEMQTYVDDAVSRVDVGIIEKGKNLIDESKLQTGSISAETGQEVEHPDFKRTDYIYLEAGNYVYSNSKGSVANYRICIYDLNKVRERTLRSEGKNAFTIDSPKYVRISDSASYLPWQLEVGTTPTEYEPYWEKIKYEYIPVDKISEEVIENIPIDDELSTDSENAVKNKVVAKAINDISQTVNKLNSQFDTPTISADLTGWVLADGTVVKTGIAVTRGKRTDYIETTGYDKVTYTTKISVSACEIAYFDENKTFLQNVSIVGNSTLKTKTVDIPENAKYFIVSGSEMTPTVEMFNSTGLNHRVEVLEEITKTLKGKKIMFFGDSITDTEVVKSSKYVTPLLKYTGMVKVGNLAISGSYLYHPTDYALDGNPTETANKSVPNQVQKVLNNSADYDTPDIIFIFAGTNGNVSVANLDETQFAGAVENCDLTTFSGAMRWIYEKLMSLYPNALVVFVTPLQSAKTDRPYSDMLIRRNGIIENCERLALDYIDAFRVSGIYSGLEFNNANGKYLSDGLHPNTDGGVKLAKCFQNELMKLVHKL
jgi:lysophospholipase L1-like esterase